MIISLAISFHITDTLHTQEGSVQGSLIPKHVGVWSVTYLHTPHSKLVHKSQFSPDPIVRYRRKAPTEREQKGTVKKGKGRMEKT